MFQKRSLEEIEQDFRARALQYVAVSDHEGLRKLFAKMTAQAGMAHGEAGVDYMAAVLADVLREPLQRIRKGLFDHII
jgi:hypothetical protein